MNNKFLDLMKKTDPTQTIRNQASQDQQSKQLQQNNQNTIRSTSQNNTNLQAQNIRNPSLKQPIAQLDPQQHIDNKQNTSQEEHKQQNPTDQIIASNQNHLKKQPTFEIDTTRQNQNNFRMNNQQMVPPNSNNDVNSWQNQSFEPQVQEQSDKQFYNFGNPLLVPPQAKETKRSDQKQNKNNGQYKPEEINNNSADNQQRRVSANFGENGQPIQNLSNQNNSFARNLQNVVDHHKQMAQIKPIFSTDKDQSYQQILPHHVLPSFNNSDDYNQRQLESYGNGYVEQTINMNDYLKDPKIKLINLSMSYKVDLFLKTKLYQQLETLEQQKIQLTQNQNQLVAREKHLYNILSQRSMEFLEFTDFLVPYQILFNKLIRQEIMDNKTKMNTKSLRPLLLKKRDDQLKYFIGHHASNVEPYTDEEKIKLFEGGTVVFMVFPIADIAVAEPQEGILNKNFLLSHSNQVCQQTQQLRYQAGLVTKFTILHGFKIYIFADKNSPEPQHEFRLPLRFQNVYKAEYQLLLKSDDGSAGLEIMSDTDIKVTEWYQELVKCVTFKQFMFISGRSCSSPQKNKKTKFLKQFVIVMQVDLQEGDLTESDNNKEPANPVFKEVIVNFYINLFFLVRQKLQIQIMDFTGQKLPQFVMRTLFQEIDSKSNKCRLTELILDDNKFDSDLILSLSKYLESFNSLDLKVLSLNYLKILDDGMFVLSQSLIKRHVFMRSQKQQDQMLASQIDDQEEKAYNLSHRNPQNYVNSENKARRDIYFHNYQLPLLKLNLRCTSLTDTGVSQLCQALQKINDINLKNNGQESDYTSKLSLDISENDITENSLRNIGALLIKFNAVNYLNISKCYGLDTVYSEYFFDSLCVTKFLKFKLDMSCIKLSEKAFQGVIKLISTNCCLKNIKIQISQEFNEFISKYPNRALLRLLQVDVRKEPNSLMKQYQRDETIQMDQDE